MGPPRLSRSRAAGWPSLAVMLAWRPALYALLMPELEPAFGRLKTTGDWGRWSRPGSRSLAGCAGWPGASKTSWTNPQSHLTEWLRRKSSSAIWLPWGL